ncbi:glycosyltransferase [Nitrosomonas sp.]|uniref:glycosyltransferase n=1 Tax=Nitrosomonas sp. TaxID=42353 RepID=UPI00258FE734|nr:glycosyltransferase [Nitrosomonas sp.]
MHIAIYLPSLRGGGAERAMATLANGFADRGLKVDLVLAQAEGPYLSEVSPGVRVVNLQSGRVLPSLPGLVRYLRRERPQAVLSALNHANVIAVVARMLAGVPVRLVVSERNNVSLSGSSSKNLRSRVVPHMMRWAYRKADGVTAVSGGVADDLANAINLPRDRISVIFNPVVTPELIVSGGVADDLANAINLPRDRISVIFNPVVTPELIEKSRMPLEHPWLGEGKPPVILGVGRLTPQKDFSTLIHAFAQVRTVRDCRLVILGEGELRAELEQLVASLGVQDSVQLPGFADNPFAWMSRVRLFVLSSRWEGLPNVLIQAMACGAAVVSTNCPSGPDEILEGGKWGRLVPVGDVEALAEALSENLQVLDVVNSIERAMFFNVENAINAYLRLLMPR